LSALSKHVRAKTNRSCGGITPEVGERLDLQGWTIEVVDLDGRRIDKLLVGQAA
jgi:CBS domain containing-hemolysin-like protein